MMQEQQHNTGNKTWSVRQADQSPSLMLENFKMYRILEDSGFEGVGCELVVLEPGKVLEPHVHKKGHAVILVLGGDGYALINGARHPLRQHSVINLPPGTEHGLEAGSAPLVVYGFQVPAIIDANNDADIYFTKDNRKGEVESVAANA